MKLPILWVLILCISLTTTAQTLPTASGSCGISQSGLMSCDWLSPIPIRNADNHVSGGHPELVVTRFVLAPGAPLRRLVEGQDELIIGMEEGELVNEIKSPPLHLPMSKGAVLLMPKEESYVLRNTGKKELDILVVRTRR